MKTASRQLLFAQTARPPTAVVARSARRYQLQVGPERVVARSRSAQRLLTARSPVASRQGEGPIIRPTADVRLGCWSWSSCPESAICDSLEIRPRSEFA